MSGVGWSGLLQLLAALIAAISKATTMHIERVARDEQRRIGRLEALNAALAEAVALVEDAADARRDFRDRLNADPNSLYDDDGYRRSDSFKGSIRDPTSD